MISDERMTDEQFVEFVKQNTTLVRATLQTAFQFWRIVSTWFANASENVAWAGMMAFGREADNLGAQFDEILKIRTESK